MKTEKDKISIIINFGMLVIAVLSALFAFNSYRLNRTVAEEQKRIIEKQLESFDSQDKLNKEQVEYFHSQKAINERNLKYIEDLMSPDIYFVAIPKCRIKYTIGKVSCVRHSAFIKNPELEFRINNRGEKPINLIDIVAYGTCHKYTENEYLLMIDLKYQNLKAGDQKTFNSIVLKYDKINTDCEIFFELITTDGKFKTKLIIE